MAWKCNKCGKTDPSDSLNFPMTHDLRDGCDGEVEPDLSTAARWGDLIGGA